MNCTMIKKKILWITADYFVDCDIPNIPDILSDFDIHWMVYLPYNSRYNEKDFTGLSNKYSNLKLEIVRSHCKERSPKKIFEYMRIIKAIKREKPDLVYVNMVSMSPWQIPMFLSLPKDKTILTAHQGRVHAGMRFYRYNNLLRDIAYRRVANVNMFSKSQATHFLSRYQKSNVCVIPLGLKYFGEPTNNRPTPEQCVRLLMFGLIVKNKNLPILVDAVNNLYEKGIKDIQIVIRGKGYAIDELKNHIRYPEIVDAQFGYVDNEEIPNLFNSCHYLVLPYKEMSQSGPFKVAMQYNLPLITSDLPGFTDEMSIGETGFVFKNDDVADLEAILMKCYSIAKNDQEYSLLRERMRCNVLANYSKQSIVKAYVDMFNKLIS